MCSTVATLWQPVQETWKVMTISLWSSLLMTSSVWSACVWPETHSKSTAVERCSVRDIWRYTRSIQQSVLNVEKISSVLLIKEVSKPSGEQLYGTCIIYTHIYHNTTGERHILSLKARCDNTPSGCEWAGGLCSLDEHLASCDFTLLPCPNECHNKSKVVRLLRKYMEKYTKEECPRRQYKCPHCQGVSRYDN